MPNCLFLSTKVINYYKILQIAEDADPETIKKAYRALAKQYHPDLNPHTRENIQAFRLVQEAWEALRDPVKRQWYDKRLRSAQQSRKEAPSFTASRGRNDRRRRKPSREELLQRMAKLRQVEILQHQRSNIFFPFQKRIFLASLFALNGLLIVYRHWFINLQSYGQLYALLGLILFLMSTIWISSSYYRIMRYRFITGKGNRKFERNSIALIFFIILTGGGLVAGGSSLRKWYHLKEYPVVVVGKVLRADRSGEMHVFYDWNRRRFEKKMSFSNDRVYQSYQQSGVVLIKLSRIDPRIAVLAENHL